MDTYQEGSGAVVEDDGGEGPFEKRPGQALLEGGRPVALILVNDLGGLDEDC